MGGGTLDAVPALPGRLVRAWRALERFAESRRAAPALFLAALAVYGAVSLRSPVSGGRDLARYLMVYAQLFEDVVFPYALVSRPPGTPLVAGGAARRGPDRHRDRCGAALRVLDPRVVLGRAALRAGRSDRDGCRTPALPGLRAPVPHALERRALRSGVRALCGAARPRARAAQRGSRCGSRRGVAGLALVRPVAQVLLLLRARSAARGVELASAGSRARPRSPSRRSCPSSRGRATTPIRGDDFTLSRGGGSTLPLFRAFVADRIVEPENGPASRELARAVARDLLPYEPYRSYGIGLDEFFGSGSARMHDDLTSLADRNWGWDDDYRQLARVGREAVFAHPGDYARGVAGDIRDLLVWPLYVPVPAESTAERRSQAARAGARPAGAERG